MVGYTKQTNGPLSSIKVVEIINKLSDCQLSLRLENVLLLSVNCIVYSFGKSTRGSLTGTYLILNIYAVTMS